MVQPALRSRSFRAKDGRGFESLPRYSFPRFSVPDYDVVRLCALVASLRLAVQVAEPPYSIVRCGLTIVPEGRRLPVCCGRHVAISVTAVAKGHRHPYLAKSRDYGLDAYPTRICLESGRVPGCVLCRPRGRRRGPHHHRGFAPDDATSARRRVLFWTESRALSLTG